jgi:hypothetical protein
MGLSTAAGRICRRCQHLVRNATRFLFQRIVARPYAELVLQAFLALAFRAFAG